MTACYWNKEPLLTMIQRVAITDSAVVTIVLMIS